MLIIDHYRRHYYANLPKCGCSSVKMAMAERMGATVEDVVKPPYMRGDKAAGPLQEQNFFGWTIVRNPFARLVSCWSELHPPFRDEILQQNVALWRMRYFSFAEFIECVVCQSPETMNDHYRPMAEALRAIISGDPHPPAPVLVDVAYYLERVDEAWPALQERFDLPPLQHCRKREHPPYQKMYTPGLRGMVEKRYEADLRIFHYDFDGPTKKGPTSCEFA